MNKDTTFFSYSRSDSAFVLKLAKELRESGGELWLDQLDIVPGSRWDVSVEQALKDSGTLIVVMSDVSVASENVMDEVSYAFDSGMRIIPIQITECEIPLRLRRLQRINFSENYESGLNSLKTVLNLSLNTSHSYVHTNHNSQQTDSTHRTINTPDASSSGQKSSLKQNESTFHKYKNYVFAGIGIGLIGFVIFLISVASKSSGNTSLNDSISSDTINTIGEEDNSEFYHTWTGVSLTNAHGEEQIGNFSKFEMDLFDDGRCQIIAASEHLKIEKGTFEIDHPNKQIIIYSDGDTTFFDYVINKNSLTLKDNGEKMEFTRE